MENGNRIKNYLFCKKLHDFMKRTGIQPPEFGNFRCASQRISLVMFIQFESSV